MKRALEVGLLGEGESVERWFTDTREAKDLAHGVHGVVVVRLTLGEEDIKSLPELPSSWQDVLLLDVNAQALGVIAQQAMAGIKRWNCTSVDPVCWVCGKCTAHCDRDFGKGLSPILSHWTWYGQVLRSIVPKYRPPDYALHGVTRVTHSGLDGC